MLAEVYEADSAKYLRRERFVVFVYAFCFMLALSRVIRQRWAEMERIWPTLNQADVLHRLYAPEAYRVAIPFVINHAKRMFSHLSLSSAIAVSDFLFGLAALYLLYSIVINGYSLAPEMRSKRAMLTIMTLAAVHFPFLWTVDWLRNVTIPCAFYLVCSLWMLQRIATRKFWIAPLLLLTVWQGLVRSDVAFTFGVAVALLAFAGLLEDLGPRVLMLSAGVAVVLIAGGVQFYLQTIAFPHLTYPPDTPVFVGRLNLNRERLLPFLVAMLPVGLIYMGAIAQRRYLRSIDILCLAAPLLYLPLWFAVGSLQEIRVFMPFYLILVPPAANIVVRFLLSPQDGTQSMQAA